MQFLNVKCILILRFFREASVEGRLLDCDTSVRTEAISVVCDLAKFSLKNFPEVLITRAIDRLRDKMVMFLDDCSFIS